MKMHRISLQTFFLFGGRGLQDWSVHFSFGWGGARGGGERQKSREEPDPRTGNMDRESQVRRTLDSVRPQLRLSSEVGPFNDNNKKYNNNFVIIIIYLFCLDVPY